MRKFSILAGVCAVFVSLVSMAGAPIQARALVAQANTPSTPQATAQTFTGTIAKSGDTFTLNDSANKTTYTLDDTQRASQFVGKSVKVTGTLDSQTKMIHVQSIQAG